MTTHHLDTQLLHIGSAPFDPKSGTAPVSLPAIRTSTVRFENLEALERAFAKRAAGERAITYGRSGMDTHRALEEVFMELEGGTYCVLAPSGMAAINIAFLGLLKTGDHVLVGDCVYGPVRNLDRALLQGLGIEVTYFAPGRDDVAALIQPNTKVIYVESPGSLLFEMIDMVALAAVAKDHGLILVSDNTWGSGYIYRPLALGADVSVVAGTKYIAGHSDVMLGAVIVKDEKIAARIHSAQYAMGNSLSADDAWLALRGVKTMAVRMAQHARNALEVCKFFDSRKEVARIFHPAWHKDAGFGLWQRDCTGSNGMVSVELNCSPEAAKKFVNALTLFGIGFSWGGFESLVQWVDPGVLASHAYWSSEGHALIRLHIGLESTIDLIEDLAQALDKIKQ
jgi:cysteine-S-conjugate beta-lyase